MGLQLDGRFIDGQHPALVIPDGSRCAHVVQRGFQNIAHDFSGSILKYQQMRLGRKLGDLGRGARSQVAAKYRVSIFFAAFIRQERDGIPQISPKRRVIPPQQLCSCAVDINDRVIL